MKNCSGTSSPESQILLQIGKAESISESWKRGDGGEEARKPVKGGECELEVEDNNSDLGEEYISSLGHI
jgi:hypothetical protein